MKTLLLGALVCLLVAAPIELSAKHVVKHRAAVAQTAGCGVGQTPAPGQGCGIGDMQTGGALSSTDAIAICQQPGGCPASSTTWQLTKLNLLGAIHGSFTGTTPIVVNPATGVISCPTCGTGGVTPPSAQLLGGTGSAFTSVSVGTGLNLSGGTLTATAVGGSTTITLSPGLAATPGTYNTGTQTVTNGSTLSTQLFYEAHSTNYTVLATDGGKLLEATGAGVIFTLPAPGTAGTSSFSFSTSGGVGGTPGPYSLSTPSGIIYGCGPISTAGGSITVNWDVLLIPTGSNWKCSSSSVPNQYPVTWGPNQNLATSPLPVLRRTTGWELLNLICVVGVAAPSTATIDVYWAPDNTAPGAVTSCGSCVKLTPTASCNAAGTAGGLQGGLTAATPPALGGSSPGSVWLVGSGGGWATATTASGLIQISAIP